MYRDVVKNSKSLYRMAYSLPSVFLTYKLGHLSGAFTELAMESMGLDGRDYHYRFQDNFDLGIILNCLIMGIYVDLRKKGGDDVVGIRYEDLVGQPRECLGRILEYCRLPAELVEPGLRGLEVDSQRNSVIAKSIIGGIAEPELTAESIKRANKFLQQNRLPLIGEECVLDGTITCKKRMMVG
jgi:hypothetical protein